MSCCTSTVLLSPNGCVLPSPKLCVRFLSAKFGERKLCVSVVRASSDDPDCNAEECAPDKENRADRGADVYIPVSRKH